MRAGPCQEEIRRHNLGALLRHVHLQRADLARRAHHHAGAQPQHHRRLTADLTAAGLVSEELPRETGRAGRPSLVVRPESARVYVFAFDVEVGPAGGRPGRPGRRDPRPPGDGTAGAACSRWARLAGTLAGVRPADAAQDQRTTRSASASAAAVCGMVRRATAWSGSAPTPAGWTSRSARSWPQARPRPAGHASATTPTWPRSPSTPGASAAAATTSSTCTATSASAAASSPAAGCSAGHGGYGGEVGHMVVNPRRPALRLRLPRLLGDRDRRARRCCEPPAASDATRPGRGAAPWSTRPTGATPWPRRRCARSATGSASASPTWSTSSTRRWSSSAAPCGTSTSARAAQVRSRLNPHALPACREHVRLRTPALADDAALIGAAELAFDHVLADPLEVLARAGT